MVHGPQCTAYSGVMKPRGLRVCPQHSRTACLSATGSEIHDWNPQVEKGEEVVGSVAAPQTGLQVTEGTEQWG